jgi:hypothetical protein
VQHGPSESAIPWGAAMRSILEKIVAAGPGDAAIRYGRELGHCGVCNTELTNHLSRELGIGPVCGGRYFEDWSERKGKARARLQAAGVDPQGSLLDESEAA